MEDRGQGEGPMEGTRGQLWGATRQGPAPSPGGWRRTFIGMFLLHGKQPSPTLEGGVTVLTVTCWEPQREETECLWITDFQTPVTSAFLTPATGSVLSQMRDLAGR